MEILIKRVTAKVKSTEQSYVYSFDKRLFYLKINTGIFWLVKTPNKKRACSFLSEYVWKIDEK